MSFYIKRNIKVGGYSFELSKGGLGVKRGLMRGLRGNYIYLGSGAASYRSTVEDEKPGAGADSAMVVSSGESVLRELGRNRKRLRFAPFMLVIGLGGAGALYYYAFFLYAAIALGVSLILSIVLHAKDQARKSSVLFYDFDDGAATSAEELHNALEQLNAASRLWWIASVRRTDDWKRNAGASTLIDRTSCRIELRTPRNVRANVPVPSVAARGHHVYFMPDRIVLERGGTFMGVAYEELSYELFTEPFHEHSGAPPDAEIIGHTWRFVRRDGGPDRRFNNNRRIEIARYDRLSFRTGNRHLFDLQISRRGGFHKLMKALSKVVGDRRRTTTHVQKSDRRSVQQEPMPVENPAPQELSPGPMNSSPPPKPLVPGDLTYELSVPAVGPKPNGAYTTAEEVRAFCLIRELLTLHVDPRRIAMRDVKSYCGILLDDNNRRPICRLRFTKKSLELGLFDENRKEYKVSLSAVDDVANHVEAMRTTILRYDVG